MTDLREELALALAEAHPMSVLTSSKVAAKLLPIIERHTDFRTAYAYDCGYRAAQDRIVALEAQNAQLLESNERLSRLLNKAIVACADAIEAGEIGE